MVQVVGVEVPAAAAAAVAAAGGRQLATIRAAALALWVCAC